MGRRRINVRGFTCAHRGSCGRAARIGGPVGEKLEQMWENRCDSVPASRDGPTRQFLAVQRNSRARFDVSAMTCWEHK